MYQKLNSKSDDSVLTSERDELDKFKKYRDEIGDLIKEYPKFKKFEIDLIEYIKNTKQNTRNLETKDNGVTLGGDANLTSDHPTSGDAEKWAEESKKAMEEITKNQTDSDKTENETNTTNVSLKLTPPTDEDIHTFQRYLKEYEVKIKLMDDFMIQISNPIYEHQRGIDIRRFEIAGKQQ